MNKRDAKIEAYLGAARCLEEGVHEPAASGLFAKGCGLTDDERTMVLDGVREVAAQLKWRAFRMKAPELAEEEIGHLRPKSHRKNR